MCEAHAYILKSGEEQLVMENVDQLDVEGDDIRMINIFGEQKSVRARISKYNGSENRILLEALD
jgi:predicted RNA-binding protein